MGRLHRRRLLFTASAYAVAFCLSLAFPASGRPAILYQGYYWSYAPNPPEGPGDFMTEVAPLANLIFVIPHYVNTQVDGSALAAVRRAKSLGMEVIIDRPGDLFVHNGTRWSLASDWLDRWAAYREAYQLDVIVREGIFAIYFMDEPDGNGVTKAEQETVIRLIHDSYPGVKVMATYQGSDWLWQNGVPAELDIISFDRYGISNRAAYDSDYRFHLERIKQLTNTPILLTVESFDILITPTAEQQQWYVDTAATDPQVIGLLHFAYTDQLRNVEGATETWKGARAYPEVTEYHLRLREHVDMTSPTLSAPSGPSDDESAVLPPDRMAAPAAIGTQATPGNYGPGPAYLPPHWEWNGYGWVLQAGHLR